MMEKDKRVVLELEMVLPEDLAREAEENGLLTSQVLESLLRAELRRRRIDQLFDAADQLASLSIPPLTEAEVEAEIQSVRNRRLKSHANSS